MRKQSMLALQLPARDSSLDFKEHGYITEEFVGKGQFGRAYKVRRESDGSIWLAKSIDLASLDERDKLLSLQEAAVMQTLKHPGIVGWRESFVHRDMFLVIIMEFCERGDLAAKMEALREMNAFLDEEEIVRITAQLAEALYYIHSRNILHRDIKPSNIFLTENGDVKIGDFGISRLLTATLALASTAVGTPQYMAPEMCDAKPYTYKSDMWALGCVIHELAALESPFEAESFLALVVAITSKPPKTLPPPYSKSLQALIHRLLEKDADDRPSAKHVLSEPLIQKYRLNAAREATRMYTNPMSQKDALDSVSEGKGKPIEAIDWTASRLTAGNGILTFAAVGGGRISRTMSDVFALDNRALSYISFRPQQFQIVMYRIRKAWDRQLKDSCAGVVCTTIDEQAGTPHESTADLLGLRSDEPLTLDVLSLIVKRIEAPVSVKEMEFILDRLLLGASNDFVTIDDLFRCLEKAQWEKVYNIVSKWAVKTIGQSVSRRRLEAAFEDFDSSKNNSVSRVAFRAVLHIFFPDMESESLEDLYHFAPKTLEADVLYVQLLKDELGALMPPENQVSPQTDIISPKSEKIECSFSPLAPALYATKRSELQTSSDPQLGMRTVLSGRCMTQANQCKETEDLQAYTGLHVSSSSNSIGRERSQSSASCALELPSPRFKWLGRKDRFETLLRPLNSRCVYGFKNESCTPTRLTKCLHDLSSTVNQTGQPHDDENFLPLDFLELEDIDGCSAISSLERVRRSSLPSLSPRWNYMTNRALQLSGLRGMPSSEGPFISGKSSPVELYEHPIIVSRQNSLCVHEAAVQERSLYGCDGKMDGLEFDSSDRSTAAVTSNSFSSSCTMLDLLRSPGTSSVGMMRDAAACNDKTLLQNMPASPADRLNSIPHITQMSDTVNSLLGDIEIATLPKISIKPAEIAKIQFPLDDHLFTVTNMVSHPCDSSHHQSLHSGRAKFCKGEVLNTQLQSSRGSENHPLTETRSRLLDVSSITDNGKIKKWISCCGRLPERQPSANRFHHQRAVEGRVEAAISMQSLLHHVQAERAASCRAAAAAVQPHDASSLHAREKIVSRLLKHRSRTDDAIAGTKRTVILSFHAQRALLDRVVAKEESEMTKLIREGCLLIRAISVTLTNHRAMVDSLARRMRNSKEQDEGCSPWSSSGSLYTSEDEVIPDGVAVISSTDQFQAVDDMVAVWSSRYLFVTETLTGDIARLLNWLTHLVITLKNSPFKTFQRLNQTKELISSQFAFLAARTPSEHLRTDWDAARFFIGLVVARKSVVASSRKSSHTAKDGLLYLQLAELEAKLLNATEQEVVASWRKVGISLLSRLHAASMRHLAQLQSDSNAQMNQQRREATCSSSCIDYSPASAASPCMQEVHECKHALRKRRQSLPDFCRMDNCHY